jgi:hypothetical protein
MPPAPDPPPGARLALVVATSAYTDPGLRRLRAPAQDAADLAQVLADPDIGGFAVTTVIDQPAQQIRLVVEDFLAGRGTGDLLLLYLSCHGLLDARRRLYFAATDTRKDRLGSTGVESAWVLDQLEHCRARRQVLILDSCFSGAFAHGAKGEADLGLRDRFLGQGRGRVVLTASAATEYSFEGEPTDAATPAGSVFTAALVQGLRTGAADTDHDGHVSVDEAYAYVFDQVQAAGAAQTPQRWLYGAEGRIVLARNPAGPVSIRAPLPESLRAGLDSPHPGIRIGAVTELGEWLASGDPARAATARRHLQEIADTDIPSVARVARALLDTGTAADAPSLPVEPPPPPPAARTGVAEPAVPGSVHPSPGPAVKQVPAGPAAWQKTSPAAGTTQPPAPVTRQVPGPGAQGRPQEPRVTHGQRRRAARRRRQVAGLCLGVIAIAAGATALVLQDKPTSPPSAGALRSSGTPTPASSARPSRHSPTTGYAPAQRSSSPSPSASTSAPTVPKTYVTVCIWPTKCNGSGGTVYMSSQPADVNASADGSVTLGGLSWSGWGTSRAIGNGTMQAGLSTAPATVTLTGLEPYESDGISYEGYSTVVIQSSLRNYDYTSGTVP